MDQVNRDVAQMHYDQNVAMYKALLDISEIRGRNCIVGRIVWNALDQVHQEVTKAHYRIHGPSLVENETDVDELQEQQDFAQDGNFENMDGEDRL